jgi:alanine racemase
MVLNTDPAYFDSMEQHNLEPEVYSFEFLHTLLNWCRQKGLRDYPVHLKIDTGMHRLGFTLPDLDALGQLLASQEQLVVKSVFTHLVASEDPAEDAFTAKQLEAFQTACTGLQQRLGYAFVRHAANTAAISRHPRAHLDMVRLGVGLYGGSEGLQPVMRLLTTVAQVKQVKAGETVGYGRSGRLERDSTIATVRIGYADGYHRSLSNGRGQMYLRGSLAPVVGKVCMDMTMLDVTDIPGVQAGDRVEVFGWQVTVQEVARWCHTIPYEIMTGISQRVKRVYIEET